MYQEASEINISTASVSIYIFDFFKSQTYEGYGIISNIFNMITF